MKKNFPLNNYWNSTNNKESAMIAVPGTNKKFKRKSREPKRVFTSLESETFPVDISEVDCVDDNQMANFNKLAPLQRPLMISQDIMDNSMGILSASQEDSTSPGQSGAIDMRVGINMQSPKVSQSPASPLAYNEISHWPISISQPLTNRLKLGLHSTLPLSEPASGTTSPGHQAFCWETSLPGQSAAMSISRAPHCLDHVKTQEQKEFPRKEVGVDADTRAHLPEVKAIQQTRRLLANARERTRVHTISAAFEALRKQVPCYSYGQKLSKLAILRIACNYILSLAHLAELDYSSDHSSVSFSQCVEQCTKTLQAEGRSKKRKLQQTDPVFGKSQRVWSTKRCTNGVSHPLQLPGESSRSAGLCRSRKE
ncbi:protein atonal homolog 8 isoform X3 [Fundulus heteroclitus]|uniref:protein atonal homolog 8 isoform X3 n=1 Tax=Fundulus heteroclitus TaxID=8078 RepID=UPI00165B2944|nr:protein atonal homolog 8 isoform X3 [Fundulus heteroclitus]